MAVVQVQVPDAVAARLDAVARQVGQSREQLLLDVVEAYLAQIAEEDARIDEARAQIARGEVVDAEVVSAEAWAALRARGLTDEQRAAIRAEIRMEAEAAYGISPCE